MPFKDKKERAAYLKGYFAGYRKATIDHLGGKCVKCGKRIKLEVDHIDPILRKSRNLKDYRDLSKLQVLCQTCNGEKRDHETTPFNTVETNKHNKKL